MTNAQELWDGPRNVVDGEPGIVSQRGDRKDRHSAKGPSKSPCQSTGPPEPIESPGWHRTTYRPPQDPRPRSKPNEIRSGRFDLRLSVCLVMEFESFDAGFDNERDWHCEAMLKSLQARSLCPIRRDPSGSALRTRPWRE